jgi:hypothetical protein
MTDESPRILVGIFCDDIRNEIGNKLTLVGCYGADMLLSQFPALLPKVGVHVRIYTPIKRPVQQLSLQLTFRGEVLGVLDLDPQQLKKLVPPADMPADRKWAVFTTVLIVSPLHIQEPGELRVEGRTEEGELSPARLKIDYMRSDYNPVAFVEMSGPSPGSAQVAEPMSQRATVEPG